jgi:hypothetical protein
VHIRVVDASGGPDSDAWGVTPGLPTTAVDEDWLLDRAKGTRGAGLQLGPHACRAQTLQPAPRNYELLTGGAVALICRESPARAAQPRDSRRALPRTRRRTGVRIRPAVTGPGAAVAAMVAACVKAVTFSCHIRVYSRRSRALGGHPPVSIRVVRYPITRGAVQAISHICIQGAIQSVADGARGT